MLDYLIKLKGSWIFTFHCRLGARPLNFLKLMTFQFPKVNDGSNNV